MEDIKTFFKQLYSTESGVEYLGFSESKSKFLLVSPSHYNSLIQNLGIQIIYSILNCHPSSLAERSFLPDESVLKSLKSFKQKIISLESQKTPDNFDVVGFSISNPMQIKDFFKWMTLAKIPLLKKNRGQNTPIIIAGGMGLANPEPFLPFIDIFFIGDAQEAIIKFADIISKTSKKSEILSKSSKIQGVYVPGYSDPNLKIQPIFEKNLIKLVNSRFNFGEVSVIIDRGCKFGCDFCQYFYNSAGCYLYYDLNRIKKELSLLPLKKIKKIYIYSASAGNHPNIKEILDFIEEKGIIAEIQAVRFEQLDEEMIAHISKNITHLCLNLDAPSDRIRKIVKHGALNDNLFYNLAVKSYKKFNIHNFSVYYIINYPGETIQDLSKISRFIKRLLLIGPDININIYINPLFPSPNTPLECARMEFPEKTYKKLNGIWKSISITDQKEMLRDTRVYKFSSHSCFRQVGRIALRSISLADQLIEGLTLRGDSNSGMLLYKTFKKGFFEKDLDSIKNLRAIENFISSLCRNWRDYFAEIHNSDNLPWNNLRPTEVSNLIEKRKKILQKILK